MLKHNDTFNVGTRAKLINASPESQVRVVNAGPNKLFYKTAPDVDVEDTELAAGAAAVSESPIYVISDERTRVLVEHREGSTVQDMTVADKLTVTGEVELDGDLNHDGSKAGFFGTAPVAKPNVKPKAEVTASELCEALEKLGLIE